MNAIEITASLYQARRGMRTLFADRYDEVIEPYRARIRRFPPPERVARCTIAATAAADEAGGMAALRILAALVDVLEEA